MSVSRGTYSITPLVLRTVSRSTRIPRPQLYRRYPPAAILVPSRRLFATEHSTSQTGSSGGEFPPPGFNAEQAKKPLAQDSQQEQFKEAEEAAGDAGQSSKSSLAGKESPAKAAINEATSHARTAATEQHSASVAEGKSVTESSNDKKADKKKEEKKLTIWQKIKKEAAHYRDGTKLLGTEIKISFKLAMKMAAGYELSRREHRQLHRTVQDLGRLVPFSVFVLVPFAELLLPVALRLFPNMLPSTYESQKAKDAKSASLRSNRKEVSKFLRDTLRETGLPVSAANAQREEFIDFFRKIRTTGDTPSASDVIKVCKIFKDDLTLDNLSRPQLVGMCRYMNLNTFGTDAMLRYQIRHRMRQIKRDDRAIAYEGVESLSVPELQSACGTRGLRTQGMSPGRLRDDLQMWLDCRLRYGVPSTLLVLSNAFVYAQGKDSELSTQIDALQAVLASVPEELFHEIELEVHTAEGAATNKQRLEVLKEQQELIDEENEQNEGDEQAGRSTPKDTEDIDEKDEKKSNQEATVQAQSSNESSEAKEPKS